MKDEPVAMFTEFWIGVVVVGLYLVAFGVVVLVLRANTDDDEDQEEAEHFRQWDAEFSE